MAVKVRAAAGRVLYEGKGRRPLYRIEEERKEDETYSYVTRRKVETGYVEDFGYRVQLDEDHVGSLAHRAARNAGGRAKAGPITVTIISRVERRG